MRIAVAGKGGSGKTTIAATLARLLARRGYHVTAIDDDPNPNLATALGVQAAERERLRRVPAEVLVERREGRGAATLELSRPIHQIVDEFGVHAPDGVGLVVMTGVEQAGSGWLCGQHATVRGVIGQLGAASTQARDVTIVDMEASIEHLSRGTLRHADVLLIAVEPYFRAMETAARTVKHARDLDIPHLFAVANKVRTPIDEQVIRDYCAGRELEVVAAVPFDERVTDADRLGSALLDAAPNSAAVRAVAHLVDSLEGRLQLRPPP